MKKDINVTNNTTAVAFRSKFKSLIADFSEELISNIIHTVATFAGAMDDDTCIQILWELTYAPEKGLDSLGLKIESDSAPAMGNTEIPANLIPAFRNELRFQRTSRKKEFMQVAVSESCTSAYEAIKGTDMVVAFIAYNKCYTLCQYAAKEDIERILFLLSSSTEANYFGGIRSLHFTKDEAMFLKPFALQLHDLLDVLWNEKLSSSSEMYTPMAKLRTLIDSADLSSPADTSSSNEEKEEVTVEPIIDSKESYKTLTPANVVADSAILDSFIAAYQQIVDLGYNPSEIVEKSKAIQMLLDASKNL